MVEEPACPPVSRAPLKARRGGIRKTGTRKQYAGGEKNGCGTSLHFADDGLRKNSDAACKREQGSVHGSARPAQRAECPVRRLRRSVVHGTGRAVPSGWTRALLCTCRDISTCDNGRRTHTRELQQEPETK